MKTPEKTIDQLKREIERLQAENKALLKLASHDMRSPLNKLFALVNLLKMTGEPLTEEQNGFLLNMERVLSDGLQNMRNLIDLRAIETDQVPVNYESLDIRALIARAVREYKPVAAKKNLNIIMATEPVNTMADKLIVARIIDQVLSNAIKFSPIETEIKLTLQGGENKFSITIIDGGYGIGPDEQGDLFKKFKVLSTLTTSGESKTGIGLYIAKKYADLLRGRILYSNDNGSAFIIELPYTSLA